MSNFVNYKEIVKLFVKLGCISFGGPAVHIAMMEQEVVEKRKWMSREHFLDLIGATNIIPGPNSTEMTMHCGYHHAGWWGMILAGISFIVPAVILTSVFAYLYYHYGTLPEVEPFIYGIQPAVIAIIFHAVFRLGQKALKSVELGILGGLVVVAALIGLNEIVALFACGIIGVLIYFAKRRSAGLNSFFPIFLLVNISAISTSQIFWIFLKVGALLYGSGYVLFAFLDAELVTTGYLSQIQLIDAVAVGQFTPGPVLSTATFIGWQMNGIAGALAATIGIFMPSFIFVAILSPFIHKIRKSKILGSFLDAVNIAAVALILVVAIQMSRVTLMEPSTFIIALISLILCIKFKNINSAYIVAGGAILGYIFHLLLGR